MEFKAVTSHRTPKFNTAAIESPGSTSSGLLEQVKTGVEEAWGRLIALYGPSVYEWCRQASLHAEDAADVSQAVCGSLATAIKDFRHDRPSGSDAVDAQW